MNRKIRCPKCGGDNLRFWSWWDDGDDETLWLEEVMRRALTRRVCMDCKCKFRIAPARKLRVPKNHIELTVTVKVAKPKSWEDAESLMRIREVTEDVFADDQRKEPYQLLRKKTPVEYVDFNVDYYWVPNEKGTCFFRHIDPLDFWGQEYILKEK